MVLPAFTSDESAHLCCVDRYYESVRIKNYRTLWSLMMHDIDVALRIPYAGGFTVDLIGS
jgi:hypothetical protein